MTETAWRSHGQQIHLRPLEEFGYPWHTSSEFKPAMEAMLAGRWEKSGYMVSDMKPPINFDDHPRTHACDLHSWEPIGYALRAHEVFADERYLKLSCAFVFDWLDRYYEPVAHRSDRTHLDSLIKDTSTFTWYDMAVGRRIFRLAYLLDVLSRRTDTGQDRLDQMWRALQFHHAMLGRDHFFRANTNHGIHQALGQLAASRRFLHLPVSPPQYALARERIVTLMDRHFTSEGIHREHSPGYHYGILTTFVGALASGLLDERLKQRFAGMEKALAWMIMPNDRMAPIGDSDPKRMVRTSAFAEQFSNEALRSQLSGRKLPGSPQRGVVAYCESGYAFARLSRDGCDESDAYLFQCAAYHSDVHKHADHLGFIWHDRGRDILIDPARYAYAGRTETGSDLFNQGFWYSDPKRIYVESTRAHNCVEIDDRSYPRRNVKPWGSALRYAGEQNGLAVTDCEVTHPRSVRHRRVLVMGPGHFLLVIDWLHDRAAAHDYRQWFQLAPDWQAESAGDGYVARLAAKLDPSQQEATDAPGVVPSAPEQSASESISIFNLIDGNRTASPVRGQEEPRLQGWMSDAAYSLIPSTSVCVEATAQNSGRFATLFVFGEATVDRAATRFNVTMRNGAVAWQDGKGRHTLKLAMLEPGQVEAVLTAKAE